MQCTTRRTGRSLSIASDPARGWGPQLDALARTKKREQLLEMALGVFDAAGVVRLRLHREADVSTVSDLLVYSLDELEAVASRRGGIRQLLDEKWARIYKAGSPRGLFARTELRAAAWSPNDPLSHCETGDRTAFVSLRGPHSRGKSLRQNERRGGLAGALVAGVASHAKWPALPYSAKPRRRYT
jgi:hypothetical protein